jgi:uncharacterized protein (TIGR02646 family)
MRAIPRLPLNENTRRHLQRRQAAINAQLVSGRLEPKTIQQTWKNASKSKNLKSVRKTLEQMAGGRCRCMYCEDSVGTDIEHYRPKRTYPEHMFVWENLLLGCSLCNQMKDEHFPLENGVPLLLDPTSDNPWEHLDFDTVTGNLVPRFNRSTGSESPMGIKTVEILQLDRREALSTGYLRSYRRIVDILSSSSLPPTAQQLITRLQLADEHGLRFWGFHGNGRNDRPFLEFKATRPDLWDACASVFA